MTRFSENAVILFLAGKSLFTPHLSPDAEWLVRVFPQEHPITTHCSSSEPIQADITSFAEQAYLLATSPD